MINNKQEMNKKKRISKLPAKELIVNTKMDKRLLELLWMQQQKLKKIQLKLSMPLVQLKSLITENLMTLRTRQTKLKRTQPRRKSLRSSKTKLQVSYKKLKLMQKTFNQLSIKLLTKKKKIVS